MSDTSAVVLCYHLQDKAEADALVKWLRQDITAAKTFNAHVVSDGNAWNIVAESDLREFSVSVSKIQLAARDFGAGWLACKNSGKV